MDRQPSDFTRFYEAEFDFVWNTLRRLGVRHAHLEDVAHEVFITVWRKLPGFDSRRPLRPWVFAIAYRMAADARAKAWTWNEVSEEADLEDDGASPDAWFDAQEARTLVHRALLRVQLSRRAIFVMHELEGMTIPEIAVALGVPLNTAYSRLRLARGEFGAAVRALQSTPTEGPCFGPRLTTSEG